MSNTESGDEPPERPRPALFDAVDHVLCALVGHAFQLDKLVFTQLAVALEARSEEEPLFRIGLFKNRSMVLAFVLTVILQLLVVYLPVAQHIFDTVAMPLGDLAISIGLAVLVLVIIEAWKAIMRRRHEEGSQRIC